MSLYLRSRKRSSRPNMKAHDHLVYYSPLERILHCTCPGFNYRRICSGTRAVLSGRVA